MIVPKRSWSYHQIFDLSPLEKNGKKYGYEKIIKFCMATFLIKKLYYIIPIIMIILKNALQGSPHIWKKKVLAAFIVQQCKNSKL